MNDPKTPDGGVTGTPDSDADSAAELAALEAQDAAELAELEGMEAALRAELGLPEAAEPVVATAPPGGWLPCPCCGHQMFSDVWSDEICDVCFWQDDPFQLRYPWVEVGSNGGASLMEAQANFQRIGAVRQDLVRHVRPPAEDEPLDPGWRPFDPQRDPVEWTTGGPPHPNDLTELYWWRPTYWRRHETPAPPADS
ncbi:CPCC family cysteine-rich protein [Streptomyces sp. cg36]|uniref:CPCC family cysteine-rich protein n=1 Tax=Streptomyces sp. cg36 TaxID=3238798 RepID=UPI0034E1DC01